MNREKYFLKEINGEIMISSYNAFGDFEAMPIQTACNFLNAIVKERDNYLRLWKENKELYDSKMFNLSSVEHDRDAWKKACELAVETMRYELGRDAIKNLYADAMKNINDGSLRPDYEMAKWFYQQAQEEMKND